MNALSCKCKVVFSCWKFLPRKATSNCNQLSLTMLIIHKKITVFAFGISWYKICNETSGIPSSSLLFEELKIFYTAGLSVNLFHHIIITAHYYYSPFYLLQRCHHLLSDHSFRNRNAECRGVYHSSSNFYEIPRLRFGFDSTNSCHADDYGSMLYDNTYISTQTKMA